VIVSGKKKRPNATAAAVVFRVIESAICCGNESDLKGRTDGRKEDRKEGRKEGY
jgi:hypothetical protein